MLSLDLLVHVRFSFFTEWKNVYDFEQRVVDWRDHRDGSVKNADCCWAGSSDPGPENTSNEGTSLCLIMSSKQDYLFAIVFFCLQH